MTVCYYLEKRLAYQRMRRLIDRHDIGNALVVAIGGLQMNMTDSVARALNDIHGINLGYKDNQEREVNIGQMVCTISKVLNVITKGPKIFISPMIKNLVVKCTPSLISPALTNLLKNAIENCSKGDVHITRDKSNLVIYNQASTKDCKAIKQRYSTKGTARGFGRKSAEMLLIGLGIGLEYSVKKSQGVRTIIKFSKVKK
jgi:signal transduction histidine kinase